MKESPGRALQSTPGEAVVPPGQVGHGPSTYLQRPKTCFHLLRKTLWVKTCLGRFLQVTHSPSPLHSPKLVTWVHLSSFCQTCCLELIPFFFFFFPLRVRSWAWWCRLSSQHVGSRGRKKFKVIVSYLVLQAAWDAGDPSLTLQNS